MGESTVMHYQADDDYGNAQVTMMSMMPAKTSTGGRYLSGRFSPYAKGPGTRCVPKYSIQLLSRISQIWLPVDSKSTDPTD